MIKPPEFPLNSVARPDALPSPDTARAVDPKRWFAEARAQSAREEQELAEWQAKRSKNGGGDGGGSDGWGWFDGDGGADGGGGD